ncbi:MAG: cytochrome b5 [Haliea sp.]|nr:cytochrome b5 [Haliea sp.]|tara:strand:- start:98397 stop:98768 length:372 start_codon:yes stop_codon:yes gene_type:complete
MKKLCYSAFVAFWSSIATLLALQAVATDEAPDTQAGAAVISLEELAVHNSEADCWMAIEGKVYNLSDYLPKHPTPASMLVPWCGKEATEGMRTKGYGRDHSPMAWEMLQTYEVGTLADGASAD